MVRGVDHAAAVRRHAGRECPAHDVGQGTDGPGFQVEHLEVEDPGTGRGIDQAPVRGERGLHLVPRASGKDRLLPRGQIDQHQVDAVRVLSHDHQSGSVRRPGRPRESAVDRCHEPLLPRGQGRNAHRADAARVAHECHALPVRGGDRILHPGPVGQAHLLAGGRVEAKQILVVVERLVELSGGEVDGSVFRRSRSVAPALAVADAGFLPVCGQPPEAGRVMPVGMSPEDAAVRCVRGHGEALTGKGESAPLDDTSLLDLRLLSEQTGGQLRPPLLEKVHKRVAEDPAGRDVDGQRLDLGRLLVDEAVDGLSSEALIEPPHEVGAIEVGDGAPGECEGRAGGLVHPQQRALHGHGPQVHVEQRAPDPAAGIDSAFDQDGKPLDEPVGHRGVGEEPFAEHVIEPPIDARDAVEMKQVGHLMVDEDSLPVRPVAQVGPRVGDVGIQEDEIVGSNRGQPVGTVGVIDQHELSDRFQLVAEVAGQPLVRFFRQAEELPGQGLLPLVEVHGEVLGSERPPAKRRVGPADGIAWEQEEQQKSDEQARPAKAVATAERPHHRWTTSLVSADRYAASQMRMMTRP